MIDYTKDGRWQRLRLLVMERDGWQCCGCHADADSGAVLNVHHKSYGATLWSVPPEELQTLCRSCHESLGMHPKAGVWYAAGGRAVVVGHCPMCGDEDVDIVAETGVSCRACGDCRVYDIPVQRPTNVERARHCGHRSESTPTPVGQEIDAVLAKARREGVA